MIYVKRNFCPISDQISKLYRFVVDRNANGRLNFIENVLFSIKTRSYVLERRIMSLFDRTHIHKSDLFNLDYMLAEVIATTLKEYKKSSGESCFLVDNEDVPEELRSDDTMDYEKNKAKYDYVLGEMIYAFDDYDGCGGGRGRAKFNRQENGRKLFVKYFDSLWT